MVLKELRHEEDGSGCLQANCLAVIDEVEAKREAVLITKRGKPVAKLVPISTGTDGIYNFLGGRGAIIGDVVSPMMAPGEWGELR
jgi:antitoxin (DNA-binding transcriptional repressor) of toxin-antitoxin stability system